MAPHKTVTMKVILILTTVLTLPELQEVASSSSLSCPKGTFVKKMFWDKAGLLQQGIEVHCYAPSSLTPDAILRRYGTEPLDSSQECVTVRAFDEIKGDANTFVQNIQPYCAPINDSATLNSAVNGVVVPHSCDWEKTTFGTIDVVSFVVLNVTFITTVTGGCRDVGDVEKLCAPQDKKVPLVTCDASAAQDPRKCEYSRKYGYGLTNSFTESMQREYAFYQEFGFDLAEVSEGLSANFRQNLGYSETTGYDWFNTANSTFHKEVTVDAEVEAAPGCVTTVFEFVGECSFLQARSNHYKREDNCTNVIFTTDVYIPDNFNTGELFVSRVPEKVWKHLKLTKVSI